MGLFGCAKDGKTGAVGPKGDSVVGASGTNGLGCSVSSVPVSGDVPNGGSLITCGDGSSSLVLNGSNGVDGQAGYPGTVLTPVQFCQGFQQSYPNVFAESGFLINGVMWGVYSDHGGFMAELPPGTYSSNGINASCTFTINSDGTVTQN